MGAKPRFREMEGFAANRWRAIGLPTVHILREGIFLFDFTDVESRNRILENNWTFRGQPLILKPWTPDLDLQKMDVEKVPVWIQFHHLPLSCWTPKVLGKIASRIGKPLATDKLTANRDRLAYARVLVEMEIKDNLKYEIPVNDMGTKFLQEVIYEWRPVRCKRCKQLGHSVYV